MRVRRSSSRRELVVALAALLGGGAFAACHKTAEPEAGAVLLELDLAPGAPIPDEIRLFIYDDNGVLWQSARLPSDGPLSPESATRLGTVLIQPGDAQGTLRIDARGLRAGGLADEGTAAVPADVRATGRATVTLGNGPAADSDGDGVPDAIDDCDRPDPNQDGCHGDAAAGGNGGTGGVGGGASGAGGSAAAGGRGDAGSGGAGDGGAGSGGAGGVGGAGGIGGAGIGGAGAGGTGGGGAGGRGGMGGGAGGIGGTGGSAGGVGGAGGRALGATCTAATQCASGFCADGVCCSNACTGSCRSCNQPSSTGTCQPYAAGTDPEGECVSPAACNGAGACVGPTKQTGETCASNNECVSGFCTDGVCCNVACHDACQSCSTGTCKAVTQVQDVPECAGSNICNRMGKCVAN